MAVDTSSEQSRTLGPDLSHHLSAETRNRTVNPMKAIWRLAQQAPGIINMANGDPPPALYPISDISFTVPSAFQPDPVLAWRAGQSSTQTFTSHKDSPCALSLRTALQYGSGSGLSEVREVLKVLNAVLHSPTDDHAITLSLGNADAVTKCWRLLGNPGDAFLAEEFSFPGMTNAPLAHDIRWVPVKIDKEGLVPEDMECILSEWDESRQGRRPHVLYTVPCGQNPTGSTLPLERRKRIYDIACRWDVIIVEDDPYYFLQYDQPPISPEDVERDGFMKTFARTLTPSFLSLDTQGRVMRIDSFSKVIAPGMRLGWITCNSSFAWHLENLTDSSTQHPHGLGQAFVAEMLAGAGGWGLDGFARWLKSLGDEYQRRRDLLVRLLGEQFGSGEGLARAEVLEAGMFSWIRIDVKRHPRYREDGGRSNTRALMEELFQKVVEGGVMMMPGYTFVTVGRDGTASEIYERCNYLRTTFAAPDENLEKGMAILGKVVTAFFKA